MEALLSKVGALDGKLQDGTPYTGADIRDIGERLRALGYNSKGTEVMYCGKTGRQLDAEIFMCPTYYQRLKHLVNEKIHARGRGPLTVLTRQPVEGRARGGGLRFGEMERDCVIAHGAAAFLKERLLHSSDEYIMPVCGRCGLIGILDRRPEKKGNFYCTSCRGRDQPKMVQLPYAAKLLLQEIQSMSIVPRLMF